MARTIMEMGTVLYIFLILWAGGLVTGAPSAGPALEWAFGGGWFARSSRGVSGTYLTSEFKADIETLMGQISKKGT